MIAEKKMELQSRGVKIDWELEERLKKKFAGAESDYLSFFIGDVPVGLMNGFYTDASPYEIREYGGGYAIFKNGRLYTKIRFMPRPKFYDKKTSDGTPMEKMCKLVAPGFPIIYLNRGCVYWGPKQCKFCLVGYIDTLEEKKPKQVAETVEAGVKEGAIKTHVALTCGVLLKDKGSKLLARTTDAIKERANIPISINGEPPRNLDLINTMENADSIYINLEVFDNKVRREIMPAKSALGIDYYDKVFCRCQDVFETNQIGSVLLAGLESDESYLKGVEHLASLGIIPVVIPFYPTSLSKLNNRTPPSAARMEEIYVRSYEIIKEYGLDPFKTKAGFLRGGAIFAMKEVINEV